MSGEYQGFHHFVEEALELGAGVALGAEHAEERGPLERDLFVFSNSLGEVGELGFCLFGVEIVHVLTVGDELLVVGHFVEGLAGCGYREGGTESPLGIAVGVGGDAPVERVGEDASDLGERAGRTTESRERPWTLSFMRMVLLMSKWSTRRRACFI